jgi:hypothetical protein
VFALGGKDEYGVKSAHFEVYGLDYNEWRRLTDLPKPMERPCVAALN